MTIWNVTSFNCSAPRRVIDGIIFKASTVAGHIFGAVFARQCAWCKLRDIFHGLFIAVGIGGIDLARGTDDGFTGIAVNALHIALTDQQKQSDGRSGDGDLIGFAVDVDKGRTNSGSHQGAALHGHNGRVRDRVFLYTAANLIRNRLACIQDFHSFTGHVQMVIVTQLHGLYRCTAAGTDALVIGVCTCGWDHILLYQDLATRGTMLALR